MLSVQVGFVERFGVSCKEGGVGTAEAQGREGPGKAGLPITHLLSIPPPPPPPAHILRGTGFQPQRGLHGGLQLGCVGDIER